jgi:hypothetical protein
MRVAAKATHHESQTRSSCFLALSFPSLSLSLSLSLSRLSANDLPTWRALSLTSIVRVRVGACGCVCGPAGRFGYRGRGRTLGSVGTTHAQDPGDRGDLEPSDRGTSDRPSEVGAKGANYRGLTRRGRVGWSGPMTVTAPPGRSSRGRAAAPAARRCSAGLSTFRPQSDITRGDGGRAGAQRSPADVYSRGAAVVNGTRVPSSGLSPKASRGFPVPAATAASAAAVATAEVAQEAMVPRRLG